MVNQGSQVHQKFPIALCPKHILVESIAVSSLRSLRQVSGSWDVSVRKLCCHWVANALLTGDSREVGEEETTQMGKSDMGDDVGSGVPTLVNLGESTKPHVTWFVCRHHRKKIRLIVADYGFRDAGVEALGIPL